MRIAYFINQYPKVSHSFIRREILELERQGVEVVRYSIRRDAEGLIDKQDLDELDRTHYLLERSKKTIVASVLSLMITAPRAFFRTMLEAVTMGRQSHVGVLKHLFYFIEACVLGKWLQQLDVNHIHAHFGTNSTTVVMMSGMLYGTSYSFTVHGPEEFDKPEALSLKEKIHRASFVVAISSFGRSQLYRWCDHVHWQKIHVVHCALGEDFLHADPVPVPSDNKLVYVGRLCEQKGPLLLIEAIAKVVEKGVGIHLSLIGDGPMREELEALVDRYGLQEHVAFIGWASSQTVREILLTSRGLVLPSFAEGLPVAIMEACALRRPVITTAIAGIPELIKNGENGWLIPAGSIDDLVLALEALSICSSARLDEMGEAGYQAVLKDHNVVTEAAHLKAHLARALN